MANVILNEEHLTNIANAIRSKKGIQNNMYPRDMAEEILSITADTGGSLQVKTGTTKSPVINTGLNSIEKLILYTTSISSIGLVNTEYENGNAEINSIICTYATASNKICANLTTKDFSVSGGTFEWKYPTFALMENTDYHWIAVGS